jgi:hypothetical protein
MGSGSNVMQMQGSIRLGCRMGGLVVDGALLADLSRAARGVSRYHWLSPAPG